MRASSSCVAWFTVQGILALSWLAALYFSRGGFPLGVRIGGGVLVILGIALVVISYGALGSNHSPWSVPVDGGSLVTHGPYLWVRHPVYLGYVIAGFGGALAVASMAGVVIAAISFIYYDIRTRHEDRELAKVYAGFDAYRRRVRGQLIPGLY